MRSHQFLVRVVLVAACLVSNVQSSSSDEREPPPVEGVLTITSLSNVQDDLHYVFESAGIPEKARTIEAVANLMTAGFGSVGIDPDKPLGCAMLGRQADYLMFGFIPIKDEKQFLKLVREYVPDIRVIQAGKKEPPPSDELVVHFEHGYAFIYECKGILIRFPTPKEFIPDRAMSFDISVSFKVEQFRASIEETFKNIHTDLQQRIPDLPNTTSC